MPRAKVQPEDRQRSTIACLPCKRAKIRCDSATPCATCSKRGREASCVYQESPGRHGPRRKSQLGSPPDLSTRGSKHVSVDSNAAPTPESFDNGPASSTNDENREPQSRILLSSKLQKVYIGETASLSYLQFLRRVIKHRLGPCGFTDDGFNNFMLENELTGGQHETSDVLDLQERRKLTQVYLDATSGIFNFWHLSSAEVLSSVEDSTPLFGPATTSLMLAIGAQCRATPPSDLQHASALFAHGQAQSFEGMLCDPSLEMIRNFLLMAFYMLGSCHRNAAFMYLGVASKAASALGLHRSDQYRDLSIDECRVRLGTWKSVRVLDTIVNSILGRSSGLPGMLQSDKGLKVVRARSKYTNESIREMATQATFDICPFLDELESKSCKLDMASAENFLQRLQKWSKALPPELRTSTEISPATATSTDREIFISGTHVACVYYFAVILATRRFLTLYLLDRLQEKAAFDHSSQSPRIEDKMSSLAHVCLNAAMNLAKVGNNIMISGHMLNNMCILKAWMFAAGLLLGFSVFAQYGSSTIEAETAFHQTQAVLKKLAEHSLQAGHYYEILLSFSDAIALYQRKLADEQKHLTSQYLDQVFTGNASDGSLGVVRSTSRDANIATPTEVGAMLDTTQNLNPSDMTPNNMTTGPYGTMISEGFPWPADDLSFDSQMYEPLLDNEF